jgi:hypothetical protein
MDARLVLWEKQRLQNRFVLEMKIYAVTKSRKYPLGVRYALILVDTKTAARVLMGNHYPKGPHIHIGASELEYEFVDEDKLIQDFKSLVLENMGVML